MSNPNQKLFLQYFLGVCRCFITFRLKHRSASRFQWVDGGALESEIDVFQGKDSGMALESALSISFEFSLVVLIDLNGSGSWNAVFEVKSSRRNEIPYMGSKSVMIPNQGDDFNSSDLMGKSWVPQIVPKRPKWTNSNEFSRVIRAVRARNSHPAVQQQEGCNLKHKVILISLVAAHCSSVPSMDKIGGTAAVPK